MRLSDLITVADAAARFGRQPEAFRKAAQRGRLEAVCLGGTWITTEDAAATYVASVQLQRRAKRPRSPFPVQPSWRAMRAER